MVLINYIMSEKQDLIRRYLVTVEKATTNEIMENMPFDYHHNNNKHLGNILSNMVNKGLIIRIHKGLFRLPNQSDFKQEENTLF